MRVLFGEESLAVIELRRAIQSLCSGGSDCCPGYYNDAKVLNNLNFVEENEKNKRRVKQAILITRLAQYANELPKVIKLQKAAETVVRYMSPAQTNRLRK